MSKQALLQYTPEELARWMTALGQPAFRAKQVFSFLHKGVPFEKMHNLPAQLRLQLREQADDFPAEILEKRVSQLDGTAKYLFSMRDGHCVEGVLMHYRHGVTLCLSTQVGCRMGCSFCASTLEGLARNLTAAEMLCMLLLCNGELDGQAVGNIVLMGSGEPLDNYDEVVRFLRLASHPDGVNMGLRHISLSTCGLADNMRRLADEGLPVTLSVSLHAPDDALRKQMMPIANRYTIAEVLDACRYYIQQTGRRVIFEYALVNGVNNTPQHAWALAQLLRGMQCHVNLIPLNAVPERPLQGVTRAEAESFLQQLTALHISATLRREMGDDIAGACGQLRRQHLKLGAVHANDGEE